MLIKGRAINDFGVVAGYYTDRNYFNHVFQRTPEGKIATFDAPGAVGNSFGTISYGINDLGVVAGYYADTNDRVHGFVLFPGGQFTAFEAPRAGKSISTDGFTEGTFVGPVNLEGATTGFVVDKDAEAHAFVANPGGKAVTFDVPGQIAAPETDLGSAGEGINAFGVIVGRWHDVNYVEHGFVRFPN